MRRFRHAGRHPAGSRNQASCVEEVRVQRRFASFLDRCSAIGLDDGAGAGWNHTAELWAKAWRSEAGAACDDVRVDEFAAWSHPHGDADTLFGERDLDHARTITLDEFCSAWRGSAAR